MRIYKQLSHSERVNISVLKQSGASITLIGEQLGRSKSTISRELRRNAAPPGEYWPDTAHQKTITRRYEAVYYSEINVCDPLSQGRWLIISGRQSKLQVA